MCIILSNTKLVQTLKFNKCNLTGTIYVYFLLILWFLKFSRLAAILNIHKCTSHIQSMWTERKTERSGSNIAGVGAGFKKSPGVWAERGAAWITCSNSAPTTLILGFTNRSDWCWYKVHHDHNQVRGAILDSLWLPLIIDNRVVLLPYAFCRLPIAQYR